MECRIQTSGIVNWSFNSIHLPIIEKVCCEMFNVVFVDFHHFLYIIYDYVSCDKLVPVYIHRYNKSKQNHSTYAKCFIKHQNNCALNFFQINFAGWILSTMGYLVGFYFAILFKQSDGDILAIAVESNIPNEGDYYYYYFQVVLSLMSIRPEYFYLCCI